MFNDDFWPTPKPVIEKMLEPFENENSRKKGRLKYNLNGKSILEPSAGKGDILTFIRDHIYNGQYHEKIYSIESEPDLVTILKSKGEKVIGNDFLNYSGDYYFDLIIMNPPFSNGDKHLLKAWNILNGGEIVCLLNSETIENPYSETRKLLAKIIEDNGTVEDIGQCFTAAQRKTGVNVSLVRLSKKAQKGKFEFEFKSKSAEAKPGFDEKTLGNQVAVMDTIGNFLILFEQTKEAYINYLKAREGLKFFSGSLIDPTDNVISIAENSSSDDLEASYNAFSTTIRASAWKNILQQSNVSKYMTKRVRGEFDQFITDQGLMDLTKENIYAVISHIFDNRDNILEQAVLDAFHHMTKFHDENRHHVEGWKTNDNWKVNQKVILPYMLSFGQWDTPEHYKEHGSSFSENYNTSDRTTLNDIDIALCHLSGNKFENIKTLKDTLNKKYDEIGNVYPHDKIDTTCESTFFKLKFFKKGTLHFTFKSKKLWEKFNFTACNALNWLPENEKNEWKKKQNEKGFTSGQSKPKQERPKAPAAHEEEAAPEADLMAVLRTDHENYTDPAPVMEAEMIEAVIGQQMELF